MRRTALLCALPAVALVVAWLRLEEPPRTGAGLAVAFTAVAPALLPGLRWRMAGAAAAVVVVARIAFGLSPVALLPWRDAEWLDPLRTAIGRGVVGFYETGLPFDPAERPEMHGALLIALFGFTLAVALAASARRAVLAVGLTVAGVGWPATLVDGRGEIAVGTIALAAALWLLVLARPRPTRAVALGAVTAVGLTAIAVAAAATSLAREPVVAWQEWDLRGLAGSPVGVRYVWDANYGGIDFPERRTTVLRIRGPRQAHYWRASTLDTFAADRWIENLVPVTIAPAGAALPSDELLPPAARREQDWVRQDVEVRALRDESVVGASQPMRLESRSLGRLVLSSGGVLRAPAGLSEGQRYSVWSYAPTPTPRELLASRPRYDSGLDRYLELGRGRMPAFGAAGRTQAVEALFRTPQEAALWPYRPLWREARRLGASERAPYAATLAVEEWLRSAGGFRYEEQPPPGSGALPPLVAFVTRTRQGYCQHFAGAMTLMLRFLGIPSRVAVGFTSGRRKEGEWIVSDHDAHAWVEAWFDGIGWVPFDPTPGRGTLSASYTFASDSADAIAALGDRRLLDIGAFTGDGAGAAVADAAAADDGRDVPWPVAAGAALLAAAVAAVGLAKLLRRSRRYRSGDPRRIASATRAELADFLRDQHVEVGRDASLADLGRIVQARFAVSPGRYVAAAGRARFGPPQQAAGAAAEARRELAELLRALRECLPPGRRLRGFLALRSLRAAGTTGSGR